MGAMLATPTAQRVLLLVLVALVAAIGVVLLLRGSGGGSTDGSVVSAHDSEFAGPTLPPGLRAANFSLRDQHGRLVSLRGLRGHVVVLTFIHSKCKDTCPLMVEQIKGALNLLGGGAAAVPAVGISVAPAEDTASSRQAFLRTHAMDARLRFLNGPMAAMRAVWHAYAIEPVAGPIDHSTFVLLIDRRGIERVGFAADQLRPEDLAHDIRALERERA